MLGARDGGGASGHAGSAASGAAGSGGAAGPGAAAGSGAAATDGGVDTNDGGGAPDAGPDASDAPIPTVDPWIYVATANGVERINTAGDTFMPFGVAAPTRSVFPSPSGQLIAQELADLRVAVFAADGALRATFDVRPGLVGWSDDSTLLFLDAQAGYLRQTNVDGTTRRYVPMPTGLNAQGHIGATLSPDRTLLLTSSVPPGASNPGQYVVLVLSAVDGTLVRNLGVLSRGGGAWTGDGRLVVAAPSGTGLVAVTPRSGTSTPVPAAPALDSACGYTSWYESGKILVGKFFVMTGSDTGSCVPSALVDVDTGNTSPPGPVLPREGTSGLGLGVFAQSADGSEAAVASGRTLELGAIGGGARPQLGTASGTIVGIGWAHPTGGTADLTALPPPPKTVIGLTGAPSVASRSGSADCRTGNWVNRTPNPLPAGWPPAPRRGFPFVFDADRGALLVEGGFANKVAELPNLDYETMEWDGALGQWTNLSRADGFGPIGNRPMAYDSKSKVVLATGTNLPGDGPWSWTAELGWKNLRAPGQVFEGPTRTGGGSVYDISRDRWIVSGGYTETATWEWDGGAWQKSMAPPPGGTTQLAGARLVYDDKRAAVYSVGNRDRGTSPWLYDVAQNRWIAQPSSGPSPLPREWAGVAYDARRDRVMVFGGFALNGTGGGNTFGDLAEWDPASGAWQTCAPTGAAPMARTNAAFAYDRTRDVLVMFGGDTSDNAAATDIWEWYVP
jgi:hypothetical protein